MGRGPELNPDYSLPVLRVGSGDMATKNYTRLLAELEELKRRFGAAPRQLEQIGRAHV